MAALRSILVASLVVCVTACAGKSRSVNDGAVSGGSNSGGASGSNSGGASGSNSGGASGAVPCGKRLCPPGELCCNGVYGTCALTMSECGNDVCGPMDAVGVGGCERALGYAWDGGDCVALSGCGCEGADCTRLFPLYDECFEAYVAPCTAPPPD